MANASIRYGASIRKRQAAIRQQKSNAYKCDACGKIAVRRKGTSIWVCRNCGATYAGGAYTMSTPAGEIARQLITGLSKR